MAKERSSKPCQQALIGRGVGMVAVGGEGLRKMAVQ